MCRALPLLRAVVGYVTLLCLLLEPSSVAAFAPRGLSSQRCRTAVPVGSGTSQDMVIASSVATTASSSTGADPPRGMKARLPEHTLPPSSRLAAKKSRRPKLPTMYGLWDLVVGPVAADFKLVGMPSELTALAIEVHKATDHLTRPARLAVLQALVRSYHAYRFHKPCQITLDETGRRPSTTTAPQRAVAKALTVGAYMEQNVAVARLLGASEVDGDTMVAALLCHSPLTLEAVENEFGKAVGTILAGWKAMLGVEGQLEIKSLIHEYAHFLWGGQGDNLRNLLLVVAKDWRAVALRVAWKKVEMETTVFGAKKEEIDACWACLNVYASLAEAAGMSQIKNALEERAFKFLMPQEHRKVMTALEAKRDRYQKVLGQARKEVLQALLEDPVFMSNVERVEVRGRIKSPYSVWKKMKRKGMLVEEGEGGGEGSGMGLEGVYDMVALRVVCTPLYADKEASSASSATLPVSPPTPATLQARADLDKQMCDYVLREVVHKLRPHYKGRVKDYVGEENRKANGYQSLHTTLAYRLRGETTPVEIQIRTSEMHSVAEHGLAAHCLYKGDRTLAEVIERGQQQAEQQMQEEEDAIGPQRGFAGPGEFLTWCQKMLDKSHVIVFSPDGKLLKLNRGATLLDFVKASCLQPKAGTAQGKRGTRNKRVEEGRGCGRLHPQGLWRDDSAHEEHGGYQTVPVSRRKSKRSTQGMLLLNGQSAPALDRVLVTGDVISYM